MKKKTESNTVTQEQVDEFGKQFRRVIQYLVADGVISSCSDAEVMDPVGTGVPWIVGDDLGNKHVEIGPGVDFATNCVCFVQDSLLMIAPGSRVTFRVELHSPTIFLIPEFGQKSQIERMCPEIHLSDTPKDFYGVSGSDMDEWIAWLRSFPESIGN